MMSNENGRNRKRKRSIKEVLCSKSLLKYYDVNKPIKLTVGLRIKKYGLGVAAIQDNGVIA